MRQDTLAALPRICRIALVNPNTSAASTERMLASARAVLPDDARLQGHTAQSGQEFIADAKALEAAGAAIVLMEAMPSAVAKRVTDSLSVPTIGIGAGPDVSGQVLVVYDMLDIYPGRKARFVKNFMEGAPSVKAGIEAYVKAVKARTFPGPEHGF